MQEIPVFLFTGFMDSGKTSLIRETLFENEFGKGQKTLILMCEDGDIELDEGKLASIGAKLVMIDSVEELTRERLHELHVSHKPDQVFIEYNGTWELAPLLEMDSMDGWTIVQTLTTVDATTYEMYLNNMRTMMLEQFFISDVVIFNRCEENTPKAKFRRSVKAKNRKAQIVYERSDGTLDENYQEELPYDMSAKELDITDADYGIWYLDAMDNPKKYVGKQVHFLAQVYKPKGKMKSDVFVPGRFAMTCCAEDIQFVGFKCKYDKAETLEHRSWIDITAEVRYEFAIEYKGKGPVLYVVEVKPAEKPMDELVYFS
ncbi:MAG: GTP-binding protein [bacterium]|nr:GTP-binding protein [bacterium]